MWNVTIVSSTSLSATVRSKDGHTPSPARQRRLSGGPRCPTAVGGGLVRDFPDAIDPEQRVEVNKGGRRVCGIVEPEEDAGHIPRLRHRNDAALDVSIGGGPRLEPVGEEIFVEDPIGIGEKNP